MMFIMLILYAHDNRERVFAMGINNQAQESAFASITDPAHRRSMKILQSIDYPTAMRTAIAFSSYIFTVVLTTYIFKKI